MCMPKNIAHVDRLCPVVLPALNTTWPKLQPPLSCVPSKLNPGECRPKCSALPRWLLPGAAWVSHSPRKSLPMRLHCCILRYDEYEPKAEVSSAVWCSLLIVAASWAVCTCSVLFLIPVLTRFKSSPNWSTSVFTSSRVHASFFLFS